MVRLIERVLPDGRSIASIVFAPLDDAGGRLEFVDVGARNGSFLLPPSYTSRSRITGFEPNPAEYEKLVSGRTDASASGIKEPPFRDKQYFPDAVWSENTECTLYLTVGPGAVSLMGPANQEITSNMCIEGSGGQSYQEQHQKLIGTEPIKCVALDRIWDDASGLIDILKLDVEGAELAVIKGAKELLSQKRVLLIYSEFMFVPYYEQRVTLGHQQVFLDDLAYRLIALNLDHNRYNWKPSGIKPENDTWMTYAGDAVFVVDPDRNDLSADQLYRLGLAAMAMGFNAFGLNLIRETGKLDAADVTAIESEANRVTFTRRVHEAWKNAPDFGYRLLRALGRRD